MRSVVCVNTMIPAFPEFKKIGLDDRALAESYTDRYPPYSDFNFTSLWSWDTRNECMLSVLHGNLVVRFTDDETNEPFLSFIGMDEPERTAAELIAYAKVSDMSPTLRFVPEETAVGIRTPTLIVEEDRDNFDYICSVQELAALNGPKFNRRRHFAKRFVREHPDARFEVVHASSEIVEKYISSIFHKWEADRKFKGHKRYELHNERLAITRIFDTASAPKLIVSGIFIKDAMIAFSIDEIVSGQYCMGHFWKADTKYVGIYEFLAQKIALHLEREDVAFWNWEEDLGAAGLRKAKMSYRPTHFLKKYKVSLAQRV